MLNAETRAAVETIINMPGNVHNRLQANAYAMPNGTYPAVPARPVVLRKTVDELTTEEMRNLVQVKADYEAAVTTWKADSAEWRDLANKLTTAFRRDLEAYHDIPADHPKANRLYSIAWEYGHSSGLNDVANHYGDLVDLVK